MIKINNRIQIGLSNKLAIKLDDIGFKNKIKTRPKIIAYLIDNFVEARK
jgi:metal-responsive CopG/Arc/MetJ family transcriptional regulator